MIGEFIFSISLLSTILSLAYLVKKKTPKKAELYIWVGKGKNPFN